MNMAPCLFALDHMNVRKSDAVARRDLLQGSGFPEDGARLLLCELGLLVGASPRVGALTAPAPSCNHVGHVFGVAAKAQMGGVDASPHVATMQDVHPVGDEAVGEFPRQSMGRVFDIVNPQATVSMVADCACEDVAPGFVEAPVVIEPLLRRPMPRAFGRLFHATERITFQKAVEA